MSCFSFLRAVFNIFGIAAAMPMLLGAASAADAPRRIVSTGGPVTEIVYALGAQRDLVAVDSSSTYPQAATRLPKIGYQRMLSAEGVFGLKPTLVLASEEAGPPAVIDQLKKSGVHIVIATAEHTVAGAQSKITTIARALGKEREGQALCVRLEQQVKEAHARIADKASGSKPRVVFIYARGPGVMNVAGTGTAADAIIALAGGVNAVSDYSGYKPLTPESLTTAAPDVILVPLHGLDSLGGKEGLMRQPGVAMTPAGKNGRIVAMDDLLLLGFGPRLGEAVLELSEKLHFSK